MKHLPFPFRILLHHFRKVPTRFLINDEKKARKKGRGICDLRAIFLVEDQMPGDENRA